MKYKVFALTLLAAMAIDAFSGAYAVVIQGETTPGVYTNAAVDGSGNLAITGTVTSTITFPAQGSTTSGQTGPLVQGAVTTSAPTYTTAQTSPLSLTTGGSLRAFLMGGTLDTLTSITNPVAVTGTFWQATQPVSIATAPVLVAGSAVIGKVGIDQTTPGTTNLVALAANQSVNVAQVNGVTTLMGNGVTGTGSQRVTIASDNTAFSTNAIQSGTWTVQPGNTANTTAWKVDGSAVKQPVTVPNATTVTIITATTAATGTNYTAYGSNTCNAIDIVNNSGTVIEYRRGAAGAAIPIQAASSRLVIGISNSNAIDIRRTDTSNTQVAVVAECIVN